MILSDLQPYDVAGALVFLRETGCLVQTLDREDYDLFRHRILVAGVPEAGQSLARLVTRHYSSDTEPGGPLSTD